MRVTVNKLFFKSLACSLCSEPKDQPIHNSGMYSRNIPIELTALFMFAMKDTFKETDHETNFDSGTSKCKFLLRIHQLKC